MMHWRESVLSTRSLSYLSTADALEGIEQRLANSRQPSLVPTRQSTTTEWLDPGVAECPLFRLPRELRDKIYTYALTSDQPFWWPVEHCTQHLAPALLATSRTIYAETAPLLYSANRFMFSHPSDCNMFRFTMDQKHVQATTNICLRIRSQDVRLWTAYLGSTSPVRSLTHDLPALRVLWIFFRSSAWNHAHDPIENYKSWQFDPRLRELCLSLEHKTKAEARVICCHRVSRGHFERVRQGVGKELEVDGDGDARTPFFKIFSVNVALELSCPDRVPAQVQA
ncbi:hypothetical protein BJ546DRAFT_1058546 [Cryomyces antarcticus]